MKPQQNYSFLLRVMLIGDERVGKSSLLYRICDNTFDNGYLPTIGIDYRIKFMDIYKQGVKIQIWDTSGQSRFVDITAPFYRDSKGFIIVYDITNKQTFHNIQRWVGKLSSHATKDAIKVLVGNKTDQVNDRQVSYLEGKQLADSLGIDFIETSALNSLNVYPAFNNLAKEIIDRIIDPINLK